MLIRSHKLQKPKDPSNVRNVVISPNGNVRIDTWMKINKRDGIYLRERWAKMSHFGRSFDQETVAINDYIYSEMDNKGVVTDFVSSIKGHGSLNGQHLWEPPEIYIRPDGERVEGQRLDILSPLPVEFISDLGGTVRVMNDVHNNEFYPEEANIFEDQINAPFMLYGAALAALSAASFHVPYSAKIILDSQMGFNIPKIQKLDHLYEVPPEALRENVEGLFKFMSMINSGFREMSAQNEVNLRVHGYIHPFGCVVDIFDKELPTTHFRSFVNNSDHCRVLRTIDSVDRNYIDSRLFWGLVDNRIPSATSSLFDNSDDKAEFAHGIVTKHYVSSME